MNWILNCWQIYEFSVYSFISLNVQPWMNNAFGASLFPTLHYDLSLTNSFLISQVHPSLFTIATKSVHLCLSSFGLFLPSPGPTPSTTSSQSCPLNPHLHHHRHHPLHPPNSNPSTAGSCVSSSWWGLMVLYERWNWQHLRGRMRMIHLP